MSNGMVAQKSPCASVTKQPSDGQTWIFTVAYDMETVGGRLHLNCIVRVQGMCPRLSLMENCNGQGKHHTHLDCCIIGT